MAERCPRCDFDLAPEGDCPACGAAGGGESRARGSLTHALSFGCSLLLVAGCLGSYLLWAPDAAVPIARRAAAISQIDRSTASAPATERSADPPSAAPRQAPIAGHHPPTASEAEYLAWMELHTSEGAEQLAKKWERSLAIIARQDLTSESVLEAFLYAPREFFARRYNLKKAYDDTAIPIGHGQTISGPNMVCAMTNAVDPRPGDRVLEVGTGSGYQSAVLAELSDFVYTIEIVEPLYEETNAIYEKLETGYPQYKNIARYRGDGYFGLPDRAPFQKIIVTAGIDHIPPPLLRQLAPGGVMVIPVGPPSGQTILKIVKVPAPGGGFTFTRQDIYHGKRVKFVPFTSDQGGAHNLGDAGPEAGK